jgi:hypothetical protein
MAKKFASLLFFPLIVSFNLSAQESTANYPQDYFRNPLDIPIFLAGNFGECRPGHFHSGVDIKTQGKENLVVRAAGDGYISRIKMEKGGFGHGLYITHPNGYTTLYAHLNNFAPAIQKYVHNQQYDKKKWDVDLQLSPSQFPVKKGQQIAWSGNTGASSAPHLHFEIRNTKTEHPLNPQLFGFSIIDNMPPVPAEVAFYSDSFYEGGKLDVTLAKRGAEYKPVRTDDAAFTVTKDTVTIPAGLTGVGINVDDYMDGSDNTITFLTAKLYLDGELQTQVTLDDIGYDETRYINAYADYKTKQLERKWVQCLFKLKNNRLGRIFTKLNDHDGWVNLTSGIHKLSIVITDNKDNAATISMFLKPEPAAAAVREYECTPFRAGQVNELNDPNIAFSLDERQLYEDVCFTFQKSPATADAYSDKYRLHQPYIPLHHYFDLQIKPNKPIPFDLRNKMVLMYSDNKTEDGKAAASVDQGWYKASVRNFGTYWLAADVEPPTIKSLQKNGAILTKAKQITFEARDAMTSVKTFSGYIDGKWVCFEQHGNKFFYKFDEYCPKGKHELVFKVEDENGNANSVKLDFTR